MSDSRKSSNLAKAKREGIIEQRPQPNRNKRAKPIEVEYRLGQYSGINLSSMKKWQRWGSYRTLGEAQTMIERQLRKYPDLWEFRIKDSP